MPHAAYSLHQKAKGTFISASAQIKARARFPPNQLLFSASHPQWTDDIIVKPNGRFERVIVHWECGWWQLDGGALTLLWDSWEPETLRAGTGGLTFVGDSNFSLKLVKGWWGSHFLLGQFKSAPDLSSLGPMLNVIEPEGEHKATVILLHGMRGHSSDWSQYHEALKLSGAAWAGVKWLPLNAPLRQCSPGKRQGRSWFNYESPTNTEMAELEQLKKMRHILQQIVRAEADRLAWEGAPRRVFLVGMSQGGSMALDVALTQNIEDTVAGVAITRSSILKATASDRCADNGKHSNRPNRRLPVLVVTGTSDHIFPAEVVKRQFIPVQDVVDVSFRVLPRLEHESVHDGREIANTIEFMTKHLGLGPEGGVNVEVLAEQSSARAPPWSRPWEKLSDTEKATAGKLGFLGGRSFEDQDNVIWKTQWKQLSRDQRDAASQWGFIEETWDEFIPD